MRKHLLSYFISIFVISLAFAQVVSGQSRVTGKVIDADTKDPMTGATVTVKGTAKSTSTGLDGSFKIDVAGNESPVLVISYISYITKEVPLAGKTDLGE